MKIMELLNKLLGIKNTTTRMISGENKNVPFSKYDNISITTITYISGKTKSEHRYHRDISKSYSKIYEILSKTFGYVNFNDDWESKGYYFKKDGFPLVKIEINNVHPNLFKVSVGYIYDDSFYEIDNFEVIFFLKLKLYYKENTKVKRFLTLKQIEKVI